jgi:hypothetical protein
MGNWGRGEWEWREVDGLRVPFRVEEQRRHRQGAALEPQVVPREVRGEVESAWVGWKVEDEGGTEVGVVLEVDSQTMNVLLKVLVDEEEAEWIFVPSGLVVEADGSRRVVVVEMLEGLAELNRREAASAQEKSDCTN